MSKVTSDENMKWPLQSGASRPPASHVDTAKTAKQRLRVILQALVDNSRTLYCHSICKSCDGAPLWAVIKIQCEVMEMFWDET